MDKRELDEIREKCKRGIWMSVNPAHLSAMFEYITELEAEVARLRGLLSQPVCPHQRLITTVYGPRCADCGEAFVPRWEVKP